jgi:hypothetical protein
LRQGKVLEKLGISLEKAWKCLEKAWKSLEKLGKIWADAGVPSPRERGEG